jgi:DNA-binding NarL/FixJ family response regulator
MSRDNRVALVADESALCGAGLVHIMDSCLSLSKIFTCRNFRELAGLLGQYRSRVSLAVVQFDLPGMKRIEGLRRICESWPSLHVLVMADGCDRDTILDVLTAGSHGFIPKNSSTAELEHALTAIAGGQVFVSPTSIDVAEPASSDLGGSAKETRLTVRQKEVLDLLAEGKSNKQIASDLGISEGTVKVHVNAGFRVLGVHNRVSATTALLAHLDSRV